MSHKFKLLLLFCLIISQLDAQLSFIETDFAIHIFSKPTERSLLSISKLDNEFIQLKQQYIQIEGQLGSYEIDKSTLHRSKKLLFKSIYPVDKGLKLTYTFTFKKDNYELILEVLNVEDELVRGLELTIASELPKEINAIEFQIPDNSAGVFGGGVQFSYWNLKGHKFPLLVEENGVGRGDKGSTFLASLFGAAGNHYTTYAPLPRFYSSKQTSYELNGHSNNMVWEVDFSLNQKLSFKAKLLNHNWSDKYPSLILKSQSPIEFAQLKNNSSDYQLEDWMQGYILGVQGGKTKVDSLINRLLSSNIQVSAIWIQDWVGKRQTAIGSRLQWDWRPNYEVYPNLETWIDSLQQLDIRVLAYINPYFVEGGVQTEEGIQQGVFVKQKDGKAYKFKAGGFEAYMIDLSNQEGLIWIKGIIKENILQSGFDGWMCDFGEWLPFNDILLANTSQEGLNHNNFPSQWLRINEEAVEEYCSNSLKKQSDYFIFNRSWYSEDGSMPRTMWLGDQLANFGEHDGLASAVTGYLTSSISGIPIVHSDIGGYTAIKLGPLKFLRNDELLKRWIEMEAFTPLWRSHEGLIPEHMSQIYQDEEMMTFFAKFDSIHRSLISSHFKVALYHLKNYGTPVVRPVFMHYPDDENTFEIKNQFLVGSELLVCPVLQENVNSINVYLPEGLWKHLFTKETYMGSGYYNISVPLGQPAVFEKL